MPTINGTHSLAAARRVKTSEADLLRHCNSFSVIYQRTTRRQARQTAQSGSVQGRFLSPHVLKLPPHTTIETPLNSPTPNRSKHQAALVYAKYRISELRVLLWRSRGMGSVSAKFPTQRVNINDIAVERYALFVRDF